MRTRLNIADICADHLKDGLTLRADMEVEVTATASDVVNNDAMNERALGTVSAAPATVVVGRQGVYTPDFALDGYQLSFEPHPSSPMTTGVTQRTNAVLAGALNIGLSDLVGTRRLYVSVGADLIADPWRDWLPAHRTVLELSDDVVIDEQLLLRCRALRAHGFAIALNNFGWASEAEALLDIASIVRIDVRATPRDELTAMASECRGHDVELLADKVEDLDMIDQLRLLGFALFQGYALECPRIVAGRTIEATSLARLRGAAMMLDEDIEVSRLEEFIRTEPAMAYQIVKLACIGRPGEMARTVSSLRDAVVVIGARRVQQFIAVLLSRPSRQDDAREFLDVLARARACEILAAASMPAMASLGFAAGLISALDVVLDVPLPEIVSSMGLSGPLAAALLDPATPIGHIITDVVEHQRHNGDRTDADALVPSGLDAAYRDALAWAAHTMSATATAY